MKKSLSSRIAHLEQVHQGRSQHQDYAAQQAANLAVIERLRQDLREHGFEQSPTESFAELMCRAFGLTGEELKAELAAYASGQYRE